jgi:hypothetical protein
MQSMNYIRPFALVFVLSVSFASGCFNNYGGKQEVKGTVKLKGQPLDTGTIEFVPLEGDRATQGGAVIASGSYSIPRPLGLVPGKYRVILTSGDGRTPASDPDSAPGPTGANIVSKDRIPPEYNVNSKQEVEVSASKANVFDYDIP